MKPKLDNHNVSAICPDCKSTTTFEFKKADGGEHGNVIQAGSFTLRGNDYSRAIYRLLRCAGCGRGGLSKALDNSNNVFTLDFFSPITIKILPIPEKLPKGVEKEFRESEVCASVKSWRAASAMLRSTLEKTLKANGYKKGSLQSKIDSACKDGVITEPRKNRAHEDIRVLGNDILHEEWREVDEKEFELAHKYTQRILEDFYDDRNSVESILKSKNRMNHKKTEEGKAEEKS